MTSDYSALASFACADNLLWEVLEKLVNVGSRMAGSRGERKGLETLKPTLQDVSKREVHMEEFSIAGWRANSATLHSAGTEITGDHQVLPLPGTPSADISRGLIDLGHGRPEDFERTEIEGKIVMVTSHAPKDLDRKLHRLDKYVRALEAGADGFIYGNVTEGCLPLTGEIGWHDPPAAIPAIGVSSEVHARLARHCRAGSPKVRLQTHCRHDDATLRNIHTVLGSKSGDEVLVTAHVDTDEISEGARDNGVGCALVIEIGRLLSRVENLDNPVRLVIFGSEERGMHGAYEWVERHDLDDIKCVINIDGAGDTRDLRLMMNTFDEMTGPFERVADRLAVPLRIKRMLNTTTDRWPFAERGIPAVTVASDRRQSGRGWGHTRGHA